jgi:Ca2+-binding RTX toxin-like protein
VECGVADTGCGPEDCGGCPQGETCAGGTCFDPCENNACNGRGWCDAGVCLCDPGYGGSDCTSCADGWGPLGEECKPSNIIQGTTAGETLAGTAGNDMIQGLDGDDTIQGLDGNDYLNGNVGADTLNGNVGRDTVHGGAGDDLVQGGSGDDYVVGGGGNDEIIGGGGRDRLVGGDGNDLVDGAEDGDYYMIDGLGNDTFHDSGVAGSDAARCVPGVKVVVDTMQGADRVLTLSTGGTVRIVNNSVEAVLGCDG